MRLNDLTSRVLHPDIKAYLNGENADESKRLGALYNVVLHSLTGSEAGTWAQQAEPNPTLVRLLAHALVRPDGDRLLRQAVKLGDPLPTDAGANLTDLGQVRAALRTLAIACVAWQVGALFGDRKGSDGGDAYMSANIFAAIVGYARNVVNALDSKVQPASYERLGEVSWASASDAYAAAFRAAEGASASATPTYLAAAATSLRTLVRDPKNIPPEVQNWVFSVDAKDPSKDGATVKVFASALQPYLVFRFFGSFVEGSWNADPVTLKQQPARAGVDYYDERYARHLVLDVVQVTLRKLAGGLTGGDWTVVNGLYSAIVSYSLDASRLETGDKAMLKMYKEVTDLSARAKANTVEIAAQSGRFERRRGFLSSMSSNLSSDLRALGRRRGEFWAWVAAYTVAVVVAVGLIALRLNAALVLHASAVVALVVVVALVRVIRAWVASK